LFLFCVFVLCFLCVSGVVVAAGVVVMGKGGVSDKQKRHLLTIDAAHGVLGDGAVLGVGACEGAAAAAAGGSGGG
jgi:hypothetical protein